MANLFDALAISEIEPQRVFAVQGAGAALTYGEMVEQSARYANALTACGVLPGDRVVVQIEKCVEVLFLYLGCLRAGAIFLPANPAYTRDELEYILADSGPALFVCTAERASSTIGVRPRTVTLETSGTGSLVDLAGAASPQFATRECADGALAAILYTSGTTGKPKGAMLTHHNLASNALTLKDAWRFEPGDRLLHALPIFHTHGLFVGTNVTLAAGASMLFLPRFDLDEVIDGLAQCTVMMGVPTFYTRLLGRTDFDRRSVSGIRLFVSGSAPLSAEVHREFQHRTGHAILERYGMTETNMNTSNPYDGERRPGSVGVPLPGVEIRITDEGANALEPGEIGMIEISGPNVFAGYWNLPDKTAQDFRGRFFVSGDLGMVDLDGYLYIVGRGKDLIISGGLNVYPAEVEAAIDELRGVRESAVIGLPHPDLGEGVVAVVALEVRAPRDGAALQAALRDKLARFKQPKTILFVDELPRNAMGKVQKSLLRELHAGLFT